MTTKIDCENQRVNKALPKFIPEDAWKDSHAYRFLVHFTVDDSGVHSAVALNLPGTGSCGPTKELATERFKEAAIGVIESYIDDGEQIPWKTIPQSEVPAGAKWISVNA